MRPYTPRAGAHVDFVHSLSCIVEEYRLDDRGGRMDRVKSEQIADVSRGGGVLFCGLYHEVSSVTSNSFLLGLCRTCLPIYIQL